mmetsp:Transcript_20603/g.34377  ORF Transcript_20603/g.34377 Transcript_20603/m.34377 type:complete len:133 (+) Transcript_20603:40-438(+)
MAEKRGRGDALFRNVNRDDSLWTTAQLVTKSPLEKAKAKDATKATKVDLKSQKAPKTRSAEEILAGFRSTWARKLQDTEDAVAAAAPEAAAPLEEPPATEAPKPEPSRWSRSPSRSRSRSLAKKRRSPSSSS